MENGEQFNRIKLRKRDMETRIKHRQINRINLRKLDEEKEGKGSLLGTRDFSF